ncbi:MAG: RNA pyrophosphohydrolase [Bacteroidota bacterium]|jgi:putative (di)nucleoside polyphosphate hydrolase
MSLPYRDGVGIMLINAQRQVFVAKRIDTVSEAWQMPQGGIDAGEPADVAALRELEEETGTDKATILRESRDWLTYDLPQELVGKIWGGRYRGQRQKWFAMRFDGVDSDINIATQHPEFCEWQWTKPSNLPDLIVPFKRVLYRQIIDEFRDLF